MADLQALRLMLEDVKVTIATQIENGEHLDEKAARTIGWNGLILGLVIAAGSIASDDGLTVSVPPILVFILASGGLVALMFSVGFAIAAYRATEPRPGTRRFGEGSGIRH